MKLRFSTISDKSKELFLAYAGDAGNWSGSPLIGGGNVGGDAKAQRGNLTQLKMVGLITTYVDEGCTWLSFTDAGKEYAKKNGIDLDWVRS